MNKSINEYTETMNGSMRDTGSVTEPYGGGAFLSCLLELCGYHTVPSAKEIQESQHRFEEFN